MNRKRTVEIFSAGCAVCEETVSKVREMACADCEVTVRDMKDPSVAERAKSLGVRSVPAVAVGGVLADCCSGRGPDSEVLRDAGIGRPLA